MQIRTKFALLFILIATSIVITFSVIIYALYSNDQKKEFYSRLKAKALTTARLYSKDVKEINYKLLKVIDKNSVNSFPDERVVLYNILGLKVYSSPDDSNIAFLPPELLSNIKLHQEYYSNNNGNAVLGLVYKGSSDRLIVVASGYDKYGNDSLSFLAKTLIVACFITVIIIGLIGFFFSEQALKPIREMVRQVENISASNLNLRVKTKNKKDEIARLAINFNEMLNRIQQSFEMQKSFVSNASHELRTPLTAMTGELEVALLNDGSPIEYKEILYSVLDDVKSLNNLTNGLIELNRANMDVSFFKKYLVRMDELMWQSRSELLKRHPDYSVSIIIGNFPDDENKLIINGNHILKTALINLMDNACKFSPDRQVHVSFNVSDGLITLAFTDHGIGIPAEDLKNIFQPFYRAGNAQNFSGHGIGLSLTNRIIQLHGGNMSIESVENDHTTVTIVLPAGK